AHDVLSLGAAEAGGRADRRARRGGGAGLRSDPAWRACRRHPEWRQRRSHPALDVAGRRLIRACALAAIVVASTVIAARQEEPGSPRARAPLTFLQINDVYSTVPIDGAGGLARVATLKKQLIADGR